MLFKVSIKNIPPWLPYRKLLGSFDWCECPREDALVVAAEMDEKSACDLSARLRGLNLGGHKIECQVQPKLKRAPYRQALLEEARRMREKTPGFKKAGVLLDEEGRFSLTPEDLALDISKKYKASTVVDAGCGVGGNAIAFAREGALVTAIDNNETRLKFARHNAEIYGVATRIKFIFGDAQNMVEGMTSDLLWIDPPWGEYSRTSCSLGNFSFLKILLEKARGGAYRRILIKVPAGFDPKSISGVKCEAIFGRMEGDSRRVKFLLLER